jgi:hypothetical protein
MEQALIDRDFKRNKYGFIVKNKWVEPGHGWCLRDAKGLRFFTDEKAIDELLKIQEKEEA